MAVGAAAAGFAVSIGGSPAGADGSGAITGYQIVNGATTSVGAAGSATDSAASYTQCPAGKVALSAGASSHSHLTFVRSAYPVSNQSWLVVVTNTSSVADTFHTTSVCVDASSVPGYNYVSSASINVGSPGTASADVYCAAGQYAVGGGVRGHNPKTYLSVSRPTSDKRAWEVFVHNDATLAYQENFSVYASCIPQADVGSYTSLTATSSGYGTDLTQPISGSTALTNTASAPYCAVGQVAVGGGGTNHNQNNGYISSTGPSSDGRSWLTTSTITNPPSYTEYSYPNVVCVPGTASAVVTANNQTMTYGGAAPTFTYTVSGLANGDTLTTNPVCTSAGVTSGVGTYPITCSGASAGAHYTITYVAGTLTVKPATLTITADSKTRAYGAADPPFTYTPSGLVNGDTITTPPTCVVSDPHTDAGSYPIKCSGASAGANYTIVYVQGTLHVVQADVVVTADNKTITYGDADPSFTFSDSGFQNGDTFGTEPTCGVSGAHSDAGTYPITCSGGNAGPNYSVTFEPGTLTVDKAPLVIQADSKSIVFGDPDPAFTYTPHGLVNGDTLTTEPTCGVSGAHSDAGTYAIKCTGADAGPNYDVTEEDGTLTVAPKAAVVTPAPQTITYGDPDPTFTFSVSGLTLDQLTTQPTCGVSGAHSDAGTYQITCTGGDAGPNYTLVETATAPLTVNQATLTITPADKTITYGDPEPTFTYTPTGLVNGDTVTTEPTCGVSGAHTDAGTYPIKCTGASAGPNYAVDESATATLTVLQATVVITPDNKTITYGDPDPTFTFSDAGLLNGDTITTQPTCGVSGAHSDAGTYPIKCTGGSAGPNYTLDESATATLTVNPLTVVITPDDKTITYGDPDPTFTYTPSGLLNGDTITTQPTCGVSGAHSDAGTYTIKCTGGSAGPNYTLDETQTATLTVDKAAAVVTAPSPDVTYGAAASSVSLAPSISGLRAGDSAADAGLGSVGCTTTAPITSGGSYAVGTYPVTCSGPAETTNYTVSYTGGTLTVHKAVLNVRADNKARVFGASNPAFDVTVTGYVNGDTAATAYTGAPSLSTTATTSSHPGHYPIKVTAGSLASTDYTFTFTNGTLTVVKAPVRVTAPAINKVRSILIGKIVFTTTVTNAVTGAADPGAAVTFSATNLLGFKVSCTATTNSSGVATCSVSGFSQLFVLPPKSYLIAVAGTTDYLPGAAIGKVVLI